MRRREGGLRRVGRLLRDARRLSANGGGVSAGLKSPAIFGKPPGHDGREDSLMEIARRIMPDWCECDLYIEGPTTRVEEFLTVAKGEELPFDFNRFVPYPEKFRELDRIAEEWEKQNPPYLTRAH